jgi:hypothetical protein
VLPEIQATLARPPATAQTMMRGVGLSYVIVILAYYGVAVSGYAAFGAAVSSGEGRLLYASAGVGWLGLLGSGAALSHLFLSTDSQTTPLKAQTHAADVLLNFKQPVGVMAAANLMVVVHVAAAWQVRMPRWRSCSGSGRGSGRGSYLNCRPAHTTRSLHATDSRPPSTHMPVCHCLPTGISFTRLVCVSGLCDADL